MGSINEFFSAIGPHLAGAVMKTLAWLAKRIGHRQWVTAPEVAIQIGRSEATVHRHGKLGRFPRKRMPNGTYLYELLACVAVWRARQPRGG